MCSHLVFSSTSVFISVTVYFRKGLYAKPGRNIYKKSLVIMLGYFCKVNRPKRRKRKRRTDSKIFKG